MKSIKMVGVVAIAAAALAVLGGVGTAAAETVLCETTTTPCESAHGSGTAIDANLTGTAILETTEGTVLDKCTGSTVKGKTTSSNVATIETLSWSGCTKTTTTLKPGELEIHHITGTDSGTLTAKGTEVTVETTFGDCTFGPGPEGLDLGSLVGGAEPVIAINVIVPKISGPCPETARWTAEYKLAEPQPMFVEETTPTDFCETTTTPCDSPYDTGTTIDLSLTGTATLKTSGGTVMDTCTGGTAKGKATNTDTVAIESLTWSGCTRTTTTLKTGELKIHPIAGTDNGTLTVKGFEVTVGTIFGICTFGFPAGEFNGFSTLIGGAEPSIPINTTIPKISGPCPATAIWEAKYNLTEPTPLFVEET